MVAEVFISYSRRDRERVLPWIQRFQAAGVSVWLDEEGIEGAHLWGKEIVQAIDGCKVLMLMLSPTSAASPQVVREVSLALDAAKQIFPLLLEPVVIPADMRYALAGIQHVELFKGEPEERLQAVLRALVRLGVTVEAPKKPAEPEVATPSPAAAAPERPATNLPHQLTRFIGRDKEISEVRHLISETSLLTLVGAGGCGKTRLAVQVAGDVLEQYPDGVWLVELAALTEPGLVPQEVASVLGAREEPGRSLMQTLTEYLRPKSLLLILDNCEHLVTACAQLAHTLLRGCGDLRLLATSREALGVPGEATWHVPTLSLPNPRRLPSMERLQEYEAVQLFLDRAVLSQPAFTLTAQNAPSVAQICWRLDGIPLAIELAAARVKVLSPEQIAARLDDAFRLLTAGSRTALPRQQTLRALIDWSYNLLSEPERALLRRLSVFAGGWALEAAEAVCVGEGIEEFEVLDFLGQLMDKSLVVREEEADDARYRLLETIRQYSAETLRASGEEAAVRALHRDFYLALAEEAEPHFTGAEQERWLERLEIEHDNLRAALGCAVETGEAETALRLGASLWRFWHVRGYVREGRERLATALALPAATACSSSRAKALNAAGALAHDQGEYEEAEALHQEGLALALECDDKQNIAFAFNNLGNVALDQGNPAQAGELYQQALTLWKELGNMRGIAVLLHNLGSVERDAGRYEEATTLFEQSLAIKRELGDQRGIANSLNTLGLLAVRQGSHEQASAYLDESHQIFRALGDSYGLSMVLDSLAHLAAERGELDRAASLYRECLTALAEMENRQAIAGSLEGLAAVRAAQGDPVQAAAFYGTAEALRDATGSPLPDGERATYDQRVAAARAAIDAAAWESAWSEGRRLSLEQAIAAALREQPVPAGAH